MRRSMRMPKVNAKGWTHNQQRITGMHPPPEIPPTLLNEKYPEGVVLGSGVRRGGIMGDKWKPDSPQWVPCDRFVTEPGQKGSKRLE